jgi:hypothetical protein
VLLAGTEALHEAAMQEFRQAVLLYNEEMQGSWRLYRRMISLNGASSMECYEDITYYFVVDMLCHAEDTDLERLVFYTLLAMKDSFKGGARALCMALVKSPLNKPALGYYAVRLPAPIMVLGSGRHSLRPFPVEGRQYFTEGWHTGWLVVILDNPQWLLKALSAGTSESLTRLSLQPREPSALPCYAHVSIQGLKPVGQVGPRGIPMERWCTETRLMRLMRRWLVWRANACGLF